MAIQFKVINTGDVAAGASKETEWVTDRDILLKNMMLVEREDKSLANVQAYLNFAEQIITLDFVPGSVIGQDREYCYKPNQLIAKGARLYCKLVNSRPDSVNIDIVYEYEER